MPTPRKSDDLTREQCEAMERTVFGQLAYLRKLLTRLEELRFPQDDKLRRDVQIATDAVMGLRTTLHYLTCNAATKESRARTDGNGGGDG